MNIKLKIFLLSILLSLTRLTKIIWILVLSTLSSFAFSADIGTHGNGLQDYQLTAGFFHTCAIDDNGVQCWGRNNDGQSTVPAGLVNPIAVSAGDLHTCAIDDNGVQCWGQDSDGRSTVPAGLVNPVAVAAGVNHTCAIDDNGVQCWGQDGARQSTVPTGLVNPIAVAAASLITCALDDNGVQCWGQDGNGQSTVPAGLVNPVAVAAGGWHTCALDDNGVQCWGYDRWGQTTVPTDLVNPIALVAGGDHTCAIDDNGLQCWGLIGWGATTVPAGLVNLVGMAAGQLNTCALDDNGVQCWGWNDYGQSTVPASLMFDPDGDGVSSQGGLDAFPLDATEDTDTDGDGIGNNTDTDDDGDGVVDSQDQFPLDGSETTDFDSDGIGDNADTDDDNDGVADVDDAFPLDATENADTDSDGIGNNVDTDDDNDGVIDSQDAFPLKNTETKDSDGNGIGDNDEVRAELLASDVLSQKMIHYLGFLASVFIQDTEDVAGQSDSWNLAIGSSVNNSFACVNGGGYNTVMTRTDFTSLEITLTFLNCNYDGLTINNSAVFIWEDKHFDQPSPRQFFPMRFTFSNLSIVDSSNETFTYAGYLSCDVAYNSVTESWTERTEGETIIYEQQWGSLYDSSEPWDNNSLVINDSRNSDVFVVDGVNNCDFNSVSVAHKSHINKIINAKYIAQPNGRGYHISEYTRSERLTKALTKEVFSRQKYTEETGWITEKWSRFEHNPVVKLSGDREFGLNVYSNLVPTNYWSSRQNYGDIIDQEILQFSELDWVFLDIPTGKITADNYRSEPNTSFDYENDGARDEVKVPWAISRFASISNSESQCNWILRYQDWIIVEQGIDKQIYCELSDGFYIYDNKVWYQDANLDGTNELFTLDDDNDSVLDAPDNCQSVPNLDQLDTDNDSRGNACDNDDDNDGVLDSQDAFPLDNTESSDSDSDGVGDNTDWAPNDSSESVDTDGDGVGDNADALPTDATETLDTDGDGTGDNSDTDIDGDGLLNGDDPFPVQGQYTSDSDGDGMPDAWETRYGLDPNDPSDVTSDIDNDGVAALDEFLAGTIPSGSLDIDGNGQYDALTDGLLLLRGMFGLDGSALVTGTIASDAAYTESVDIESRIETLGDLADIDGNGEIDALTDGLLTLRYLFGLQGDTLINGVVAGDATRTTAEEIEAYLATLMPAL